MVLIHSGRTDSSVPYTIRNIIFLNVQGMLRALIGLRFVFAFMVFMAHCGVMKKFDNEFVSSLYKNFFGYGGYGVLFFFVLSGFILSHAYTDLILSVKCSVFNYFKNRILKIFPIHIFCFICCLPLVLGTLSTLNISEIFSQIFTNLTLTQSWVNDRSVFFSFNSVSWSLSNEMFFYMMFPFIIYFKNFCQI